MSHSTPDTANQLSRLRAQMRSYTSVVVCFSGGIDSTLVLAIAHEQLGSKALGLTAVSPSLSPAEQLAAKQIAEELGVRHVFRDSNEMAREAYVRNAPDRCYHCKTELYTIAKKERETQHLRLILNGTNADDIGDYRPGLSAASEAGVQSPLLALKLNKQDVRNLAKAINLRIWSKPASACLSSRIPYGTTVTEERLKQIANFEQALKELGFSEIRVRWHDKIARLETSSDALERLCSKPVREEVVKLGKAHGFAYVTVDLQGYRQGSHNEVLDGRSLKVLS